VPSVNLLPFNYGTLGKKYWTPSATEKIIHAFVSSRLDGCNSLLYGVPKCQLQRLQCIQNTAARIITKTRKFESITPVLISLNWLPVAERIEFKILLLTYKALNGLAPPYICELIQEYAPSRSLRSGLQSRLVVPMYQLLS
jgi:hypothetical protein